MVEVSYRAPEDDPSQEGASSDDSNNSLDHDNTILSVINRPIINVPEIDNASEYEEVIADDSSDDTADETVERVLRQIHRGGRVYFKVTFESGREEDVGPSNQIAHFTSMFFIWADSKIRDSIPYMPDASGLLQFLIKAGCIPQQGKRARFE